MTIQDTTNNETQFDADAAAGLNDESYLATDEHADTHSEPDSGFDEVAAAGLSDDDYLTADTVADA